MSTSAILALTALATILAGWTWFMVLFHRLLWRPHMRMLSNPWRVEE